MEKTIDWFGSLLFKYTTVWFQLSSTSLLQRVPQDWKTNNLRWYDAYDFSLRVTYKGKNSSDRCQWDFKNRDGEWYVHLIFARAATWFTKNSWFSIRWKNKNILIHFFFVIKLVWCDLSTSHLPARRLCIAYISSLPRNLEDVYLSIDSVSPVCNIYNTMLQLSEMQTVIFFSNTAANIRIVILQWRSSRQT
jgi:hypothetical protein